MTLGCSGTDVICEYEHLKVCSRVCVNPQFRMCFFVSSSFRSGTAIMQDGNTMRNNYGCDLDSLTTGSRIGMMRSASGDLHYYINGVDQGVACSGLPPGKERSVKVRHVKSGDIRLKHLSFISLSPSEVYAVIDLYGQCVQVSITSSSGPLDNSLCTSNITEKSFPIHSPGTLQGPYTGLEEHGEIGLIISRS